MIQIERSTVFGLMMLLHVTEPDEYPAPDPQWSDVELLDHADLLAMDPRLEFLRR